MLALPLCMAAGPPSDTVQRWAPAGISSDMFEAYATFDPRSGALYFVRASKAFSGWRIMMSSCEQGQWQAPVEPDFAGRGVEADPYVTPDGRELYFISTRTTGSDKSADFDIWHSDRLPSGEWAPPQRLPAPVNSPAAEWFPRPGRDGWLYFGSNRPGGVGKNDIWRAKKTGRANWTVENLGPNVNTPGDEYEPLPSPDGKWLLIEAGDGYYRSDRTKNGWSKRYRLGSQINGNGSEVGATFSPSGRSVLFSRDTGESKSGEFFVWHIDGHQNWPPSCRPDRGYRPATK